MQWKFNSSAVDEYKIADHSTNNMKRDLSNIMGDDHLGMEFYSYIGGVYSEEYCHRSACVDTDIIILLSKRYSIV